jgi:hypothetical protein
MITLFDDEMMVWVKRVKGMTQYGFIDITFIS